MNPQTEYMGIVNVNRYQHSNRTISICAILVIYSNTAVTIIITIYNEVMLSCAKIIVSPSHST